MCDKTRQQASASYFGEQLVAKIEVVKNQGRPLSDYKWCPRVAYLAKVSRDPKVTQLLIRKHYLAKMDRRGYYVADRLKVV